MAPPAKRRKRKVVDDSEAEDDDGAGTNNNTLKRYLLSSPDTKMSSTTAGGSRPTTTSPSPIRRKNLPPNTQVHAAASSRTTRSHLFHAATKSPSTSPEKSKTRAQKKAKIEEKGKTADLLTLFSKQAQKNQSSNGKKDTTLDLEDIISDPISEDDDVALHKTAVSSIVGKNAQKRFKESSQSAPVGSSASTGHRFLKAPNPTKGSTVDDDQRPWSERFAPLNLDELAVHKKKVADVRKWLEDVIGGRLRQRLLILKGAAGTGKTTTMQLLAKDMKCDILEWRNPAGSLGATRGIQSASAQFEEFLGRGGQFGQLDLDSDSDSQRSVPNRLKQDSSRRRMILIEEFPNTFMRSSSALTSFRNNILQFLAANTPALATFGQQQAADPITPIIMIISETLLTTTSASADSFTAHRLLGPEILRHPGAAVIEFNAIAPSLLAKALELVVVKEARKSGRRRTPGPLVLKRLGEIGDIRSAISSLEFLCVKGDDDADWGSKVAFTKPKRGSKESIAMTRGEQESLELISQREASLGIFHAVGKVVYNKRDELPPPRGSLRASAEELPPHLAHNSRPKPSQVSVDTLIDETGTDTHTFISALHENYILSCERSGPMDPLSSIDYINGCIGYLSESDLLCPSWDIFFGGRGFSGISYDRNLGSHILRQDEMAFQVAVRGLLFSLPHPVKRQTPHSGRGNDAFKMFYPTSLKLWRAKEEVEGLADMWATKILKGEDTGPGPPQATSSLTNGSAAFRRNNKGGSVEDWASNQRSLNYAPSSQAKTGAKAGAQDSATPPLLSLGNAARTEMLLERLPYMAHIARRRRCSFGAMGIRDLDKLVSFQGIGNPDAEADESLDDEQEEAGGAGAAGAAEAWATDKPTEESSPRKRSGIGAILSRSGGKGGGGSVAGSLPMQSLVLSDDDIEDD
ncbi:putative cell cycle checkpoint protein rad17 protein [Phialemonium atrogriseum]|uniref:Cell cycle checkpoint protein rad17 protein n=1 Tax=Phialemonium atrogriseum TaxID=1093897 RepID=A0AAJ0BX20_9PEZI|nr:putative cell cycle checkpoint protein rad17 protein [Phialemonium atrogriseum]KAK1764647.1 putative cell cycle checkpoint protein rad17 protein [Phialemonium atrogriseum]